MQARDTTAIDTKVNDSRTKIWVIVESFYESIDLMRYRIGLMCGMVIPSLQQQTDGDFIVAWRFPVGCELTDDRVKVLERSGLRWSLVGPVGDEPRCEIHLHDQVFVQNGLIAEIRELCGHGKNYHCIWSSGSKFHQGRFYSVFDASVVTGFARFGDVNDVWEPVTRMSIGSADWIMPGREEGPSSLESPCEGFDMDLAHRYISTRIATGTANGSTLAPYRSKSLIRVKRVGKVPRGKRRRDSDVAE